MTELEKFEGFMKNYQDMVYGTAVRLLGNETDAQDVAQTVFLKAFESFDTLSQSPTAGGWLKKVATNLCLNQLNRYRYRWRFFSELRSTDDGPDFIETVAATEEAADLDAPERHRLLERTLQRLPDAQRVPLVLYHFEEMSYEEIARRLNISLSKVKTDIHRARLALRRSLMHPLGKASEARPTPGAP